MSKQSEFLNTRDESLDRLVMKIARATTAHRKSFVGLDLEGHMFKTLLLDEIFLHDLIKQVFDHKREGRE